MDQFSAHLDRGWDLVQRGDTRGAEASARRALEIDPQSPEAFNLLRAAHYLDGTYEPDCYRSLGCDVEFCEAFPGDDEEVADYRSTLRAREYVQIGQSDALICGAEDAGIALDAGIDAGLRLVPNIESRLPSAPLGVRVRYYRDSNCWTEAITTDVAVE